MTVTRPENFIRSLSGLIWESFVAAVGRPAYEPYAEFDFSEYRFPVPADVAEDVSTHMAASVQLEWASRNPAFTYVQFDSRADVGSEFGIVTLSMKRVLPEEIKAQLRGPVEREESQQGTDIPDITGDEQPPVPDTGEQPE